MRVRLSRDATFELHRLDLPPHVHATSVWRLVQRRIESSRQGNVTTHEILPGEFDPVSPTLLRELEPFGGDAEHVCLALDLELTLQYLVQLGRHDLPRLSVKFKGGGA